MGNVSKGAGQGLGFAFGLLAAFAVVSYVGAKIFDQQLKHVAADAEQWLATQNARLYGDAAGVRSPHDDEQEHPE